MLSYGATTLYACSKHRPTCLCCVCMPITSSWGKLPSACLHHLHAKSFCVHALSAYLANIPAWLPPCCLPSGPPKATHLCDLQILGVHDLVVGLLALQHHVLGLRQCLTQRRDLLPLSPGEVRKEG